MQLHVLLTVSDRHTWCTDFMLVFQSFVGVIKQRLITYSNTLNNSRDFLCYYITWNTPWINFDMMNTGVYGENKTRNTKNWIIY